MRRNRRLTGSEKIWRREAGRYGRQAAGAIKRALEHEAEHQRWVALALRAKLDPEQTNAPVWRKRYEASLDVAVMQARWAAREANKALDYAERDEALRTALKEKEELDS